MMMLRDGVFRASAALVGLAVLAGASWGGDRSDAATRLAEARARAVAAFLIANGLSPEVIETAGVIDAEHLPVETGPGVTEPLNRSVAILPLPVPTG